MLIAFIWIIRITGARCLFLKERISKGQEDNLNNLN